MTQHQQILGYLKRGGKLTVLKALKMFGVYALSQRIGELRRDGHNIQPKMITLSNGKRIAQYTMGEK